jgi:uncharacterized membrane protein
MSTTTNQVRRPDPAPAEGRSPRWAPLVTLPLSVAGLGVSVYLTYVHYTEPTQLACPDTGVVNCTKVTTSPESMLFGHIPVALAGAVFFLGMAVLCLPAMWRRSERVVTWTRMAGAVAGIVMVVWLIYVEAVRVHAICVWCTVVHVIAFALFVAVLAATLWEPTEED